VDTLDGMVANATARNDAVAESRALELLTLGLDRLGRFADALAAGRRAVEAAERSGSEGQRISAVAELALALFISGHVGEAEAMLARAADEATRLGDPGLELKVRRCQANVYSRQDRLYEAMVAGRREVELQRMLGITNASSQVHAGLDLVEFGAYAEARGTLEEALKLARVIGPRNIEGLALSLLSTVTLVEGNEVQALALANASLEMAEGSRTPQMLFGAHLAVGEAELALARYDDAMRSFELATAAAVRCSGNSFLDCLAGQGRVALARGEPRDALRRIEPAVEHVLAGRSLVSVEVPRLMLWSCWRVLDANADPRADALLDLAHANLQERAASISDAAYRRMFLENVPEHRSIRSAWLARESKRAVPSLALSGTQTPG
jgi:tetratricopeptide (TPR) repeat protein